MSGSVDHLGPQPNPEGVVVSASGPGDLSEVKEVAVTQPVREATQTDPVDLDDSEAHIIHCRLHIRPVPCP